MAQDFQVLLAVYVFKLLSRKVAAADSSLPTPVLTSSAA